MMLSSVACPKGLPPRARIRVQGRDVIWDGMMLMNQEHDAFYILGEKIRV